ncbi:hypothetical protein ACTG16_21985 [Aeromonas sp. 23P]|uniref:hypothetical protein n=1 Tax=Aeromonas sp. 23P TaxID=3452716 RepID=UPI003F78B948|nr:hypothetical protein [Aeromonas veronii]
MDPKQARLEEKRMERVYRLSDYLIDTLAKKGLKLDESQVEAIAESIVNHRKETFAIFKKI